MTDDEARELLRYERDVIRDDDGRREVKCYRSSGIRLVILGRPQVKKNSRDLFIDEKGKQRNRPPKVYRGWEKDAVIQLRTQWSRIVGRRRRSPLPRTVTLNAAIVSYIGKNQRPDASNLYEGPADALELAKVIENDAQIISHDGSRKRRDWNEPRVVIYLTEGKE